MTELEQYRRDGFLLRSGLFDGAEIDAIRDDAKAIFLGQMRRLGIAGDGVPTETEFEQGMFALFERDMQAFTNAGKQAQHLISLHRLSLDSRICDELRSLGLDEPNISTRPIMYFNSSKLAKKQVYWRLDAHQDWRSMQGSLDSMVVWLPLVDVDTSLGALEIVPGSHRRGLLEANFEDGYGNLGDVADAEYEPVEVRRGDALFFSSFLVHRSGTNVTDSIRWSCHFRYNNLNESTFVERGLPHPYIYQPQEELITPDFPSVEQVVATFES